MQAKGLLSRGQVGVLMLAGILLAGCAGVPAAKPVALGDDEGRVKFHTGRVTVYVTNADGLPLAKAMVDLESTEGDEYFRTAAFSDNYGKVSFAGVPETVRISVYHAETQSNYSRMFDIPSSGTTELRMLLYQQ